MIERLSFTFELIRLRAFAFNCFATVFASVDWLIKQLSTCCNLLLRSIKSYYDTL